MIQRMEQLINKEWMRGLQKHLIMFNYWPSAKPKQRSTKVRLVKVMDFPVVMYGCKSWTIKKAQRWRIDAFELWCWRTLESHLDCKEIQPVQPKGDQSWVFIGRTVEAETPVLWPPDVKSWFIWKDLDSGKDWGQKEKGTSEDEMVRWHHRLNGRGFG